MSEADNKAVIPAGQIPEEVKVALEYLLRVASKSHMAVAGFVFSSESLAVMNFGNCTGQSEVELFSQLCQMFAEHRTDGRIIHTKMGKVQ